MKTKLLLAEMVLLLASVLVFRGLWLIMDEYAFMNEGPALWISLLIGLVVTVPTIQYILENSKKK